MDHFQSALAPEHYASDAKYTISGKKELLPLIVNNCLFYIENCYNGAFMMSLFLSVKHVYLIVKHVDLIAPNNFFSTRRIFCWVVWMYFTINIVKGPDCQILAVSLQPGEEHESEAGAMMFMSPGIKTSVECGRCTRLCVGESCLKTVYKNETSKPGYIGLTPNFPAKVIPVDLSEHKELYLQKGAYFSAFGPVEVSCDVDFNCFRACFGGIGCIRQQANGTGTIFLGGGGTVVSKVLAEGETFVVDESSLLGYQSTVDVGLRFAGGCCTCCFAGEGMFLTTMTGPGLILLHSMPFGKFYNAVKPPQQSGDGGATEGGEGGGD